MRGSLLTLTDFVNRSSKIHGIYDYSKSDYINNKIPVNIICPIHGSFKQPPFTHLAGHGCPKCAIDRRSEKSRHSITDFISRAKTMFGDKYDYSNVDYRNAFKKIKIKCKIHGNFLIRPNDHLSGHGCYECGREKTATSIRSTKQKFIENANIINNGRYDYSLVEYKTNSTKVIIICVKHGEFFQSPNNHLNGQQCPKCNVSKGEEEIRKYLENNRIDYIFQKTFDNCRNPKTNRKLKFDYYIPHKNLLIEYDGEQHYRTGKSGSHYTSKTELQNLKQRDEIKTKYAAANKISLLRIKYTEINKINEILASTLK